MTLMAVKTDPQIQETVSQELRFDSRLRETSICVDVDKGIVTLRGAVDSYAQKLVAQETVYRVHGVVDVANFIHVNTQPGRFPADMEITRAVRQALEADALAPHNRIPFHVSNGWVTLEGSVACWSDRLEIERAICCLVGIRGIINHIQILAPKVDAQKLHRDIDAALVRQGVSDQIQVEVENGTVVLKGSVPSWCAKKEALRAVGFATGVRLIIDHIRIGPAA